jgi:lipoprotein signal peptidase
MRFGVFIVALLLALPDIAAAQSSKHERDMQTIDATMQTVKLTPAQRAQVTKLRQEGAKLHYAGNHGAADSAFEKAKAILASAR